MVLRKELKSLKRCKYCQSEFYPNTYNQIYCNPDCTRLATNERIMDNYYKRKENRKGRARRCAFRSCETKLSRYNDDDYCSVHQKLRLDTSFIKEWV